jgi:hypothetical protein
MWVVVGVVTLVVIIATYLTWTAARVDRLNARAAAAFSALDAQSTRRAASAADFGERHGLTELESSAKAVLGADRDDRELAENDLTKTLRAAVAKVEPDGQPSALDGVLEASRRLALARQVHNDLVRDALAMRRRPLVRLLRLGHRHPQPRFFDIDEPTLDNGSPRS